MFRTKFVLSCCLLVVLAAGVASANTIVKIRVDDTIQPISAEYIDRAIEHARQTNADAVLIELNTPGGLLETTRSIVKTILAAPVPRYRLRRTEWCTRGVSGILPPGVG
jgi:membrane-bound serine protease (ClpP class)